MKQYVDLMIKVQHYLQDDLITTSGEGDWDNGGWT